MQIEPIINNNRLRCLCAWQVDDEDVVGCGRYYCTFCCRYFESALVLEEHENSKTHKKSVKRKKFDEEMDAKHTKAKADYQAKRAKLSVANEVTMKEEWIVDDLSQIFSQ